MPVFAREVESLLPLYRAVKKNIYVHNVRSLKRTFISPGKGNKTHVNIIVAT